jgi:hypothetical protein
MDSVRGLPAGSRTALVLLSMGVIAAVALTWGLPTGGGQKNPSAKGAGTPTLEGKKLPEVGDISPGKYATDEFEPAMSFTLDKGWQIGVQAREVLSLVAPDIGVPPKGAPDTGPPSLSFVNPAKVYKPLDPSAGEQLSPVPKDMAAWIRDHPELKVEKSEPVTIGGVSGTQFDVSVIAPKGGDAVLFRVADSEFFLANEKENRIILLEDVAGDTVVITIEGTKAELEASLPMIQEVLDSVKWENASWRDAALN